MKMRIIRLLLILCLVLNSGSKSLGQSYEKSFTLEQGDNWGSESYNVLPAVFYCEMKNSFVFFYLVYTDRYWGKRLSMYSMDLNSGGVFLPAIHRGDINLTEKPEATLHDFIDKYPFPVKAVKCSYEIDLGKSLIKYSGKYTDFKSTEVSGIEVYTKKKENLIRIVVNKSALSELVNLKQSQPGVEISNSIPAKYLDYKIEDSKQYSDFRKLVIEEGLKNPVIVNYIIQKNAGHLCNYLSGINNPCIFYFYGAVELTKETKLALLKAFYERSGSYEENQRWINKNVRHNIPEITEAELYAVARPKTITSVEAYKNLLQFYPEETNNDSLNRKIYADFQSKPVELSQLLAVNPKILDKSQTDEKELYDKIKSGADIFTFMQLFPKAVKTKKCRINQYYSGSLLNGLANGKGKSLNDSVLYIGDFKNGKYYGYGKLYNKSGNLEFEGDFVNGIPEGRGKYYWYSTVPRAIKGINGMYLNYTYEGGMAKWDFEGFGKYTYYCTSYGFDDDYINYTLEGNFKNGKKEGYFTEHHIEDNGKPTENEFTAEGLFVNDLRDGLWVLKTRDKSFGLNMARSEDKYYKNGVLVVRENSGYVLNPSKDMADYSIKKSYDNSSLFDRTKTENIEVKCKKSGRAITFFRYYLDKDNSNTWYIGGPGFFGSSYEDYSKALEAAINKLNCN